MTFFQSVQAAAGELEVNDPATGEIIARVKAYNLDEISQLIGLADAARHAWAAQPSKERSAIPINQRMKLSGRNQSQLAYHRSMLSEQVKEVPMDPPSDEIQRRINKQYLKLLEKNEDLDSRIKSKFFFQSIAKIKSIEREKNQQLQQLAKQMRGEQQEKSELKILLNESR